jgi:hypothetical protein
VTVVPVEVFDHEADMMIRLGWLDQRDRQHRRRVGRAVADLLERVLDRAARARGWL